MSNLSRIQANNDNLDVCIAKANALPDAGSGGGSVETCTVNFSVGKYYDDTNEMYMPSQLCVMAVVIENGVKRCLDTASSTDRIGNGKSIVVEKNSIVAFTVRPIGGNSYGTVTISNGDAVLGMGSVYGVCIMVTSDCTISVTF